MLQMLRPAAVLLGMFSHLSAKMGSDGNLAGDVTAKGQSRDVTASDRLNPGTRTKTPRFSFKALQYIGSRSLRFFKLCFFFICFCDCLAVAKST